MINLNFGLRFPNYNRFRNIWCQHYSTPFQFKFLEMQIYASADIVSFEVDYTKKQDHAGLHFGVGFLGYNFDFNFYDSRHWDNENNCWH